MPLWPTLAAILLLLLWYLISHFWADSIRHQRPVLYDSVSQRRYGWRCPRCGSVFPPLCGHGGCRGPLMWTGAQGRILCGRCGRHFVCHPWLFHEAPLPWPRYCRRCAWFGMIRHWQVD